MQTKAVTLYKNDRFPSIQCLPTSGKKVPTHQTWLLTLKNSVLPKKKTNICSHIISNGLSSFCQHKQVTQKGCLHFRYAYAHTRAHTCTHRKQMTLSANSGLVLSLSYSVTSEFAETRGSKIGADTDTGFRGKVCVMKESQSSPFIKKKKSSG